MHRASCAARAAAGSPVGAALAGPSCSPTSSPRWPTPGELNFFLCHRGSGPGVSELAACYRSLQPRRHQLLQPGVHVVAEKAASALLVVPARERTNSLAPAYRQPAPPPARAIAVLSSSELGWQSGARLARSSTRAAACAQLLQRDEGGHRLTVDLICVEARFELVCECRAAASALTRAATSAHVEETQGACAASECGPAASCGALRAHSSYTPWSRTAAGDMR